MTNPFLMTAQRKRAMSLDISNPPAKRIKSEQEPDSETSWTRLVTKLNVGGSSALKWVNKFIESEELRSCRENLFSKISLFETSRGGCYQVLGFTQDTRPQIDTKLRPAFTRICPDGPERFSPYVISLIKEQICVPDFDPPSYPATLRKVKQSRTSSAAENNEKSATWVASHLCHNRRCINTEHLRWEPSWMNRLRDNCAGGDACIHRPGACISPHRDASKLIDWTVYIDNRGLVTSDNTSNVLKVQPWHE